MSWSLSVSGHNDDTAAEAAALSAAVPKLRDLLSDAALGVTSASLSSASGVVDLTSAPVAGQVGTVDPEAPAEAPADTADVPSASVFVDATNTPGAENTGTAEAPPSTEAPATTDAAWEAVADKLHELLSLLDEMKGATP